MIRLHKDTLKTTCGLLVPIQTTAMSRLHTDLLQILRATGLTGFAEETKTPGNDSLVSLNPVFLSDVPGVA